MKPLVIGHRGASAAFPENTVAAFAGAVALGADGVELDVRLGADGSLVVHHDPIFADGRDVHAAACDDLPPDVCLLAAAFEACGEPGPDGFLVNVEIKADGPGGGVPLVDPVVAAIEAWGGRALVSSFDHRTVDAVRAAAPHIDTAQLTFLLDRPVDVTVEWIARRGHVAWHPHHASVDAAAVELAHTAGLAVNTWTVDDPARIAELAATGVDAIVTNDVAGARQALGRR